MPYAWEARPYALVLGFAAAALLCHQFRVDGVRPRVAVVGLALALAGATAVHYHAALVVRPIVFAEAVRVTMRRRLDWPVVAAFLAPLVPLAISTPMLREARRYSGQFWTEFHLGSTADVFLALLRVEVFSSSRIPNWLGLGVTVVVLGTALVVLLRRPRRVQTEVAAAVGSSFHSWASSSASSRQAPTRSDTSSPPSSDRRFSYRSRCTRRERACGGRGVRGSRAHALVRSALQYWHRDIGVDIDRRERLVAFLEQHVPSGEMVAVVHPRDSLELARYAHESLRDRLVRLSDPGRALRYTGSRSTEDGLVVLSDFAPVRSSSTRLSRHRSSSCAPCVEARGTGSSPHSPDDGARLDVVAEDAVDGFTLVRVEPRR